MRTGQVFPALVRALEDYRVRPQADLAAFVGASADIFELRLDGELVRIEVSASWCPAKQNVVVIEAVAYGPAAWHTERVSERIRIALQSPLKPASAES
jgi:hypothetical protein